MPGARRRSPSGTATHASDRPTRAGRRTGFTSKPTAASSRGAVADQPRDADWRPARVEEPKAWLALAHPIRIRVLNQLQHRDRARPTDLAVAIGVPVNSVSFHLRQLARFGYVERVVDAGDARERWWRTTSPDGFRISAARADPEQAAAMDVLQPLMRALAHDLVDAWFEADDDAIHPPAKSANHDLVVDLTDAEIDQLQQEIGAVLRHWADHGRAQQSAGDRDGRRAYRMFGFAAHEAVLEPRASQAPATAAAGRPGREPARKARPAEPRGAAR